MFYYKYKSVLSVLSVFEIKKNSVIQSEQYFGKFLPKN